MTVLHRLVEGEAEEWQVGVGSGGMVEGRSSIDEFLGNEKAAYGKGWAKVLSKV